MRTFRLVALLAIVVAIARPAETSASARPRVEGAWSRPALAGSMGIVYATIRGGRDHDRLVAVETSVARTTELDETVRVAIPATAGRGTDAIPAASGMEMHPVASLAVPPAATVALRPGGYHVMLIDLRRALVPGMRIPLVFRFASGASVRAVGTVRT